MIVGAVALVVAGVGFSVFLQSKEDQGSAENPDYVRAAKLLPEARREAEAMFGSLTWEEYRTEKGIAFQDDTAAWAEVVSNMPAIVEDQYESTPPYPRAHGEIFVAEREWFSKVRGQVEGLRIMHVLAEDGEYWAHLIFRSCGDIFKALFVGIQGAAEEGDAEAVLEIGRASNAIIAALDAEPSTTHRLYTMALQTITDHAILRSAVRSRSDAAVLRSLQTVLDERSPTPTIREVMNAEARSQSLEFQRVGRLSPYEIDEMLNAVNVYDSVFGEWGPEPKGSTGMRTADALETRYWESAVHYTRLFEDLVAQKPGARQEINSLDDTLKRTNDVSYWLAASPTFSWTVDIHLRYVFDDLAVPAAIALIERYPVHADLPEALPADLSFPDPFGGGPVIYHKTPHGFAIDSRHSNPLSNRFPINTFPLHEPVRRESEVAISYFEGGTVWGLRVSYDPIMSVP